MNYFIAYMGISRKIRKAAILKIHTTTTKIKELFYFRGLRMPDKSCIVYGLI